MLPMVEERRHVRSMTVTVRVPSMLRASCQGLPEIFVSAATVGAALTELERSHPALYRSVCDETGRIRRHVNIFVNTSHIRDLAAMETSLAPGDVISIMPAVSGGSKCRSE